MKCPLCGKEMFEVDPIFVADHSHNEPDFCLKQEVCYRCGFTVLRNSKFEEYKRVYREYKEAINETNNAKIELEKEKKNAKSELDKLDKIREVVKQRDALPVEKDDDILLKELLLKKKQTKIENSVNRDVVLKIRGLENKISEAEIKINKIKASNQYIIDFVESNHLENC